MDLRQQSFHLPQSESPPLGRAEQIRKRVFDFVISLVALFFLVPLFLIVALAIKLESPGPVLFRQRRRGFSRKEFQIFKFRSMKVVEDGPQINQAQKDDPRVTRIGRFLRITSIDELPQLLNVLRGEMSLVGPRPHAVAHDDFYTNLIENYAYRHHMKPGLTGWAQVNGYRGPTPRIEDMEKRIQYDLYYINNWSLSFDIAILFKTIKVVFCGDKNAF